MAGRILDFYIKNKEHLNAWEDKKEAGFYTLSYQRAVIRYELKQFNRGQSMDFWLVAKDGGELLGKIAVFCMSGGNLSSCMIGYKLDCEAQSHGYMTEALNAIVDFLFNELNLHRAEICIVPRNLRSIRLAERAGFVYEGQSSRFMRINGVWEDHVRYVKINENYKEC